MGFEPNMLSFDPEEPSENIISELPGGGQAQVLISKNSIIKTFIKSPANRKYINTFVPIWSQDVFSFDSANPDTGRFLIAREMVTIDDTFMYDYISIEEEEVNINLLPSGETYIDEDGIERSDISKRFLTISYGPKEAERLFSLYANAVPQLQVTLDEDPSGATAITTNSVKGDGLTFNSLSSLGPISQETLTLSVTSDSEGTAIEQREAVVTDVGGLYATGERENTYTAAQEEAAIRDFLGEGPGPSTVIITSGY